MEFIGHGKGTSSFAFTKVPEGTKVVWGMDGDAGMNPMGRFFGAMMDKMMGSTFESGLQSMKEVAEKMPATASSDLKVQEVATPQMYALVTNFKCSAAPGEISKNFGEAYGHINEYISKNGLKGTGQPFSVTNAYANGKADMDAGMPVDKMGKSNGNIKAVDMKPGNALKVSYMGPYNGIKSGYMALASYSAEHHKEATGKPWEVYITDPMTEKDSTKWLTEIYMPVK
jgi:effector-binding domain-containing protein